MPHRGPRTRTKLAPYPHHLISPSTSSPFFASQDRNGQVDGAELQNMLAAGGLVFSLQTVMQIIRLHNTRDSGQLDFAEFKQVQQFLSNVQASFQYFNQSKSGRLDKSEVLRALHHAGFGHVDEGAVKAACQAFDPDRTNSLSLDQYIAMTLFLLNSKMPPEMH